MAAEFQVFGGYRPPWAVEFPGFYAVTARCTCPQQHVCVEIVDVDRADEVLWFEVGQSITDAMERVHGG